MTAFFCSRVRSATGTLNFPCTSCNRLLKASSLKGWRYFPFALSPIQYLNKKKLIRNAIHLSWQYNYVIVSAFKSVGCHPDFWAWKLTPNWTTPMQLGFDWWMSCVQVVGRSLSNQSSTFFLSLAFRHFTPQFPPLSLVWSTLRSGEAVQAHFPNSGG